MSPTRHSLGARGGRFRERRTAKESAEAVIEKVRTISRGPLTAEPSSDLGDEHSRSAAGAFDENSVKIAVAVSSPAGIGYFGLDLPDAVEPRKSRELRGPEGG